MEMSLSENIRRLRKQRKLTQEQLAEVLGVSTGAVHKWESGMSVPELRLIVEMADFFDTSVDVLLGYRMKDNRLASTLQRLSEYCRGRDPEALTEAEKALKKYPHSFEVVHHCAAVYAMFGVGSGGREKTRRALELLEQARLLIAQNTDPEISDATICGEMAGVYIALGEIEKGVSILKDHNAGGMFSDAIGNSLAIGLKRPEEAEPFLQEALLRSSVSLLNTITGYAFVFCSRGDYTAANMLLLRGMEQLKWLKPGSEPDFSDKIAAVILGLLAYTHLKTGKAAEARAALEEAAVLTVRFDTAPNYRFSSFPYGMAPENVNIHDSLGATARESLETLFRLLKHPELSELWKEVGAHE